MSGSNDSHYRELATLPSAVPNMDPQSNDLLNSLNAKHMSSGKLKRVIDTSKRQLLASTPGKFVSLKGNLSTTELLEGLFIKGESLVSENVNITYTTLNLKDKTGQVVSTFDGGMAMMTDRRLLLVSSSYTQGLSLTEFGDPKKLPGGYSITMRCSDTVVYFPINLSNFRSILLKGASGVRDQIDIVGRKPCCFGFLGRLGFLKRWDPTGIATTSTNVMLLQFGVLMPPWNTEMTLELVIDNSMHTVAVRDFLALFQTYAVNLN